MRKPKRLWLAALMLSLISSPVHAAWKPIGPDGGEIAALGIAPGRPATLYALTFMSGAFRSDDGGLTWRGLGLAGQCGFALGIDPHSSSTVHVATSRDCSNRGGRLWQSRNGGTSWELVNTGLWHPRGQAEARTVLALASSRRRSPGRIYAGASEGVARSLDGGRTWRVSQPPERGDDVFAVAIDPGDARVVYGGGFEGVFKSTDGGRRWTSSGLGLGRRRVTAFAIDPGAPDTLYAATWPDGLFKSTDAAATWMRNGPAAADGALAVGLEPRSPSIVYAAFTECSRLPCTIRVWRSTDGGTTWAEPGPTSPEQVRALAIHPSRSSTLYAGTESLGVFYSEDGSTTWTQRSRGLTALGTPSIVADDAGRLFAATRLGVMYRDGDEPWQPGNGLPAEEAGVVAVGGDRIYAGFDSGLYESADRGVSWQPTGLRDVSVSVVSMASDASTIYAGTRGDGLDVVGTIWRSVDRGATWTHAGFGGDVDQTVTAIVVHPTHGGVVYAGTRHQGFHKSTDAGQTWTELRHGLSSRAVLALAIDRTNPRILYAGLGYSEVYPRAGGEEVRPGGLFRSTDGGESWAALGDELREMTVTAFLQHPTSADRLWAATTRGVYESSDRGRTWHRFSKGLLERRVVALAIDTRAQARLLAGTANTGVHQRPLDEPSN